MCLGLDSGTLADTFFSFFFSFLFFFFFFFLEWGWRGGGGGGRGGMLKIVNKCADCSVNSKSIDHFRRSSCKVTGTRTARYTLLHPLLVKNLLSSAKWFRIFRERQNLNFLRQFNFADFAFERSDLKMFIVAIFCQCWQAYASRNSHTYVTKHTHILIIF